MINTPEEFFTFVKEAKENNGKIIRQEVYEYGKEHQPPTESSDEFVGMYVHGGQRELSIEEDAVAFASFRAFSEKIYPLYFFYAENDKGSADAMKQICSLYGPIELIPIDPLKSMEDYNRFMVFEAFQQIPEKHENILTFQSDGFLKERGWEEFIREYDPDFLGAPWFTPIETSSWEICKDKDKYDIPNDLILNIGNGGFSFRKRSKMIEASELINEDDILWPQAEDAIFAFFGYGSGLFKNIPVNIAKEFSNDPYNRDSGYGFHGFL